MQHVQQNIEILRHTEWRSNAWVCLNFSSYWIMDCMEMQSNSMRRGLLEDRLLFGLFHLRVY